MKRMLALLLAAALLLSGCDLLPAEVTDPLPGANGTHKENADPGSQAPRIDQNTGIALHDNAPDLAEAGIEEYLAYFQESADFVNMPDFRDERNPYEERLAAEKEALGRKFSDGAGSHFKGRLPLCVCVCVCVCVCACACTFSCV